MSLRVNTNLKMKKYPLTKEDHHDIRHCRNISGNSNSNLHLYDSESDMSMLRIMHSRQDDVRSIYEDRSVITESYNRTDKGDIMGVELYPHQKNVLKSLRTGSILCGGTGSGKSRTALAYFHTKCGGELNPFKEMKSPKELYIITTARKRDEKEWDNELIPFLLFESKHVHIDSWNNIKKYIEVENAFFIFDEQRVIGKGAWVKAFYKIAKKNDWILLSATPGDCWADYIPVFVANGYFRNRTEFYENHVIWDYRSKFQKIDRYINTGRLIRLRNNILINMDFEKQTIPHHEEVFCDYDSRQYKDLFKFRYNKEKDKPIENASELCYEARKIVNSDPSRLNKVIDILEEKHKAIIFYNYDYELDLLHDIFDNTTYEVAEWNGHKHQPVPESDKWVYFVQYNAGSEAWNCIKTDTIIFYSQNYSYKIMLQASGRIDRLNTPYVDLYYYHLKSRSGIDLAISKALRTKKKFNELKFITDI